MPSIEFNKAAVVGTGMMGPGIAVSLGLAGVRTTILSRTAEGAAQGLQKALLQVQVLEEHGLADSRQATWTRSHISSSTEFDQAIADVDLVIESAPEDMLFKQDLFARMDNLARSDAVLATNTSGLSVTEIARKCSRPERVLTTHFWNPPHLMKLVEIVRGEKTSEEVVTAVKGLLEKAGKAVVVVKKDRPGQLGNRLQLALQREAVHIVGEGIASVEDVDLAVKTGFGMRLPVYGVFEHLDAVGLDMALAIMDYIAQDLYSERKAPDLLRNLVSGNALGAKSGQGFYNWEKNDFESVKSRRDQFLLEFLKSKFASQS